MAIETERRQSGLWSVLYQPDIPPRTINKFQKIFDYLGIVVITDVRFAAMTKMNMACFQATNAFAASTNTLLSYDGFKVDNQPWLIFSEKINLHGTPQLGHNVLRIAETKIDAPFALIDPACYLYDIPYKEMPIAVGNQNFLERAMSELYSSATKKYLTTKLQFH
ncbi:hypothetical protein COY87_03010 [Candidatus Roizmanbacteria bacterium CG_4_10_14_0_8_um_filter_33_9]|uniref:Uncharacterized protein n=1 Tax=Candidatus Roizmanbacteria bacterium CG_4_10_14_0_8_um_filter_33_9 TaxID=1974826 RepID=A0A2M7QJL2_9BACT|nr:MAG: hypothetical protein COY87_03010 [Candidatus Roizmanbacteria bacterium CG_4_10_14_0_8_um_filter_33_9]